MKTNYIFSNWSSVSKMKNCENHLLRISVEVLRNKISSSDELSKRFVTAGYHVKIYNVVTDEVVYAFYVDFATPKNSPPIASLTTKQAVELLNAVGFTCQYVRDDILINDRAYEVLCALKGLGYTKLVRECFPSRINVVGKGKQTYLDELSIWYNYNDFNFTTPQVEYDINRLINTYEAGDCI